MASSRPFAALFPAQLDADGVRILPLETAALARLVELPFHHRDPFDRLLIAQALVEDLPILTRDPVFTSYGVETVWD